MLHFQLRGGRVATRQPASDRRRPGPGLRPVGQAFGRALAALALLVQVLLPLADAGWHAAGHAEARQVAAGPVGGTGKHTPQPGPHSGLVDDACQLCLAIQFAGAAPVAAPPTPVAPSAFIRLAAVTAPTVVVPAPRAPPHQPRAPPVRA
jgi:hypothetical protein